MLLLGREGVLRFAQDDAGLQVAFDSATSRLHTS